MEGRRDKQGVPTWGRLMPLRAVAWIKISQRARQGDLIDRKKINKHLTYIIKLPRLLQPNHVIELPEKLRSDLQAFVQALVTMNNPVQSEAMC